MLYSFNDAGARERHETQYFEMFGNRGIYHKGWTAVTKHGTPWVLMGRKPVPLDDDVWELYDTSKDWSQANDLASVAPSILPNNMLFQIGKQQTGFLLDTNTMTQLGALHMCDGVSAFGANAFDGSRLFVPCSNHIQEVNVDVAHRSMSLGWVGPATGAAGSPILAGGSVWTIDRASGTLYVLDPANGAVRSTLSVEAPNHAYSQS